MLVERKAYWRRLPHSIKKVRVQASTYHISTEGRSRGRKGSGTKPWIQRKGKLGGAGFLSKAPPMQKVLLDQCVRKYGYRSCLGSIMVLQRSELLEARYGRKLAELKQYILSKYGGSWN